MGVPQAMLETSGILPKGEVAVNYQKAKIGSIGTGAIVTMLQLLAANIVFATETCPVNASGPDICFDWNLTGTPVNGVHIEVDCQTDASNPVAILLGA